MNQILVKVNNHSSFHAGVEMSSPLTAAHHCSADQASPGSLQSFLA